MRLLVVDDDQVFREEFSEFLTDEGHEVASAPSVRKALELLEGTPVDAVFTDLKMPRQTGLELLTEVRHRWPQVFVVMVTGYATVQTAVEAMKSGAFDYIAKPFRSEQVKQVLALIQEQRKFTAAGLPTSSGEELARQVAERHQTTVLVAAREPIARHPHLQHFPFDGGAPSELLHALEGFLAEHPHGGLVIADAAAMLPGHRREDVLAVLSQLRDKLDGVGPFAVGLDPDRISQADAEAIRSAITAPSVQSALEALSSPIRRRVLYRLSQGPASFTEAMRAAELDDSPKLAFHMHRLVDEGLVTRDQEHYAITPKGSAAVGILREMEDVSAQRGPRSFVYLHRAGARPGRGA